MLSSRSGGLMDLIEGGTPAEILAGRLPEFSCRLLSRTGSSVIHVGLCVEPMVPY